MELIIHRVNKIKDLKKIPNKYGAEIDIRSHRSNLILNHEPYSRGDNFVNYLENYKHKTLVLNIKESGIENDVISLVKKFKIKTYFLLDVEMPYVFLALKKGIKDIAIRFSEYENILMVKKFKNKLNWVWIDTLTELPINKNNYQILRKFKSVLVCPERWGRPYDIKKYKLKLNKLKFKPYAVMTNFKYIQYWEN